MTEDAPFPGWAPLAAVTMIRSMRDRLRPVHAPASAGMPCESCLDALIVAIGAGLLLWLAIVAPQFRHGRTPSILAFAAPIAAAACWSLVAGRGDGWRRRSTHRRLVLLGLSCLGAPAGLLVGALRGHVDVVPAAIWGGVLVALVVARMALLFRDQRAVEAELRETKRILEEAQELARIGPWSFEVAERRLVWPRQAYRVTGVDMSHGRVEAYYEHIHPEDRARVQALTADAYGGRPFDTEYRIVREDGETRWIHGRGRLERDADGQPLRVAGVIQDVTERRANEDALRERERMLRAVFDGSTDGFVVIDDDGAYVDVNPAACEIFGRRRGELVGRRVGSQSEEQPTEALFLSFREGRVHHAEIALRRPDGSDRHVDVTGIPNVLPDRHLIVVRDVTARREAEGAVREAEAKYRTLVEQLPLVTYVNELSMDVRPIYVSPQIEQLFGYPIEAWLEDPHFWERVVHPDDVERIVEETEAFKRDGEAFELEYRNVAADGRIVWVLDRMMVVRDADGNPICYQGCLVDTTERKEAEARYRTLVERLPLASYVTPLNWAEQPIYISPQFEQLLGYSVAEWLAEPGLFDRVLHPEDAERVLREFRRVHGERQGVNLEYRLLARDGRVVWVLDEMVVVRDEADRPLCFQGFLLDITSRKELEEQLGQSQRLETVGRLAGGIAHDFNNLLTAITGYTTLALERPGARDERLRRDLEEVRRASERAASLTQQLLAFSRRQVLQPRAVDLHEVVSGIERLLERLIGDDVELRIAHRGRPWVHADPGRLEQVLVNLAVNARDAMPRGGTLSLETDELELDEEAGARLFGAPPGRYATLTVADTGCGMSSETIERAFEPFYTTKEIGKGTGLGLSTVYGIVKQSGGWIDVVSAPGEGAAFTIYLPLTRASVAAPEPVRSERPRGAETVLLVEDEPTVRALVAEMLEEQGYEVIEAAGPHEALAAGAGRSCDLLLTDVVMPKMNGRELAQRLRQERPGLEVVFTSGYTPEAVLQRGALAPGEHFLQKPFSADELAAKVRTALDGGGALVASRVLG